MAQPGTADWLKAAAALDPSNGPDWHVFISHAGNVADKPFARSLRSLLIRTGWGLRVFLDDDSLVPAGDPQSDMKAAMQSAAVGVLLFSAEFFSRQATLVELQLLVDRHALKRVRLLPVFLRMQVEECKRSVATVLRRGGFLAAGPVLKALALLTLH